MSKMGLAGQDELTRQYNLPTLASDNKLYMHTQNNNIAVLPKKNKKKTNKCMSYRIQILEPSGAGIKVH